MKAEIISTKPGALSLDFYGGKVELTVPDGYTTKKLNVGNTPGYTFEGPKNEDGKSPCLIMYILLAPVGTDMPPIKELMDAMLKPFRTRLAEYKEEPKEVLKVGAREYENTGYSGALNNRGIKGALYISKMKNGFLVITATDAASSYDKSEPAMTGIIKSSHFTEVEVAVRPVDVGIIAPEIVAATANPQKLQFKEHKMELNLPPDYTIYKMTPDSRSEYSFSGPRNDDGTRPGVMFFLIYLRPDETRPSAKAVMETMIMPGKTNLTDFKRQDNAAVDINGVSFENSDFSGFVPDGKSIKGFFYVGILPSAICVLTGRDGGDHYKDSEATLRGIVKSCKVLSK